MIGQSRKPGGHDRPFDLLGDWDSGQDRFLAGVVQIESDQPWAAGLMQRSLFGFEWGEADAKPSRVLSSFKIMLIRSRTWIRTLALEGVKRRRSSPRPGSRDWVVTLVQFR